MIPKIIHYVWMGRGEKPKKIQKCIKTWKKHLKDYEFIEWNEDNFDIKSNPYVAKAYEEKKWAFVSDYIRMWAIDKFGGIYLDTDVYIIRDLEPLLKNRAFVGFENKRYPFTAVFGAEKGHPLIKKILQYYKNLKSYDFNFEDNNTISVSQILIEDYGCKRNNSEQTLKDDIRVYPDGVLCNPSKDSYAIHLFFGSWTGKNNFEKKKKEFFRRTLKNKTNIKIFLICSKMKNCLRILK